jgi:hypothetical protein
MLCELEQTRSELARTHSILFPDITSVAWCRKRQVQLLPFRRQ